MTIGLYAIASLGLSQFVVLSVPSNTSTGHLRPEPAVDCFSQRGSKENHGAAMKHAVCDNSRNSSARRLHFAIQIIFNLIDHFVQTGNDASGKPIPSPLEVLISVLIYHMLEYGNADFVGSSAMILVGIFFVGFVIVSTCATRCLSLEKGNPFHRLRGFLYAHGCVLKKETAACLYGNLTSTKDDYHTRSQPSSEATKRWIRRRSKCSNNNPFPWPLRNETVAHGREHSAHKSVSSNSFHNQGIPAVLGERAVPPSCSQQTTRNKYQTPPLNDAGHPYHTSMASLPGLDVHLFRSLPSYPNGKVIIAIYSLLKFPHVALAAPIGDNDVDNPSNQDSISSTILILLLVVPTLFIALFSKAIPANISLAYTGFVSVASTLTIKEADQMPAYGPYAVSASWFVLAVALFHRERAQFPEDQRASFTVWVFPVTGFFWYFVAALSPDDTVAAFPVSFSLGIGVVANLYELLSAIIGVFPRRQQ